MKIVDIEVIPVSVPFEAPIVSRAFTSSWSQTAKHTEGVMGNVQTGAMDSALRCVVKVHTDDGIVGLGETRGSRVVQTILSSMVHECVGLDPFGIERLIEHLYWMPYFTGYDGHAAIAGIEMACWDIMGKATGQPLYNLLGGSYRQSVETNCYLFFRQPTVEGIGGEMTSQALVDYAKSCQAKYGFRVFKLKAGIGSSTLDIETTALLREQLGPSIEIVVDPNAAWTYPEAVRTLKKLEPYDPFYVEDPCQGMEAMSRLKRHTDISLGTNMCVVDLESLGVALRMTPMPVDVILFDTNKWGGILATKKLTAACEITNLSVAHHSSPNVGIADAAMLHLAASTPQINIPLDCLQHHLTDDIITEPFRYANGFIDVPNGIGLGVELDEDKLQKYAARYQKVVGS